MKENNDSESFDHDKSETTEKRNYFVSGKLLHQTSKSDIASSDSTVNLQLEQARIMEDFNRLMQLFVAKQS